MTSIPRTALLLGIAGLIPFLWGVVTLHSDAAANLTLSLLGPRFVGPYIQLFYGTVILSFMSGVLWGFATKTTGSAAAAGYVLSVIPALWAFFMTGGGPVSSGVNLITGFLGLLILDFYFSRAGLTPQWWMKLRILLTSGVVACLIPVVW